MTLREIIEKWRAMPEAEQIRQRRENIPESVYWSMWMEGEPVSLEWLKEIHARRMQQEELKRQAES